MAEKYGVPRSVRRNRPRRPSRPRRVKAAPFSLLDTVDRKRGRTRPYRAKPVRQLQRQAAAGRRARRRYRQGYPVKTGGRKYQVKTAGGRTKLLTPAQYRRAIRQYERNVQGRYERALRSLPPPRGRPQRPLTLIDPIRRDYRESLIARTQTKYRPPRVRKARLNLPGTAISVGLPIAAGTLSRYGRVLKRNALPIAMAGGVEELTHAGRDLATLPANVISSGYYTGKALYKAAGGDTRELRQIGRDFVEHDPIVLAARGKFGRARKEFSAHPLLTGLEVYGGTGAALRTAGRAGRYARTGKGAPAVRHRRAVPNTNIVQVERFSKNPVVAAGQRRRDTRARRERDEYIAAAHRAQAENRPEVAAELIDRADKVDPDRVPGRYIRSRADRREGMYQAMRRPGRAQTAVASQEALTGRPVRALSRIRAVGNRRARRAGAHPTIVRLVAEGGVAPTRRAFEEFIGELDDHARSGKLSRTQLQKNRKTRRAVEQALESDPDFNEVRARARALAEVQRPLEQALIDEGALNPAEAERSKLVVHAQRRLGADLVEEKVGRHPVGIVRNAEEVRPLARRAQAIEAELAKLPDPDKPEGQSHAAVEVRAELEREHQQIVQTIHDNKISNAEIRASMRDEGMDPDNLSFVAHRGGGDGDYNVNARQVPGIPTQPRSGRAFARGEIDPSADRLVGQNVRMRGLVDAIRHFSSTVRELGVRDHNGEVIVKDTRAEAEEVARESMVDAHGAPIPGAHELVAVRLQPFKGREDQAAKMLAEADDEGYLPREAGGRVHPMSEAIEDALQGKGDGGKWIVIPKEARDQLIEHARVSGSVPVPIRVVSQAFRRTVLPFSLPWITGNVVEGQLRALVFGANVVSDRRFFNQTVAELARTGNEQLAAELLHRLPSGHYGGVSEGMVRTSSNQMRPGRMRGLFRAMEKVSKKRGPKEVAGVFRAYTDWMFGTANAMLEAGPSKAMAGRHLKRELVSKRDIDTMGTAVEQAARGLLDTNEQARMAEVVRRAYGQYDSFGPGARKFIMGYTPFGAWTWNAVKFLFSVLPKDHPGLTALLAVNHRLSEEWRKDKGLDAYWASAVPDFLQGSIPLPGGGHLRAARYTPFGFAANPLDTVASNVVPFLNGPLMTFRGLDWKGDKLEGDPDVYKKLWIAAREFGFATIPLTGQISRGLQKDGSPISKAWQTINPFNPVKPREDRRKKRRKRTRKHPIDRAIDDALGGGDSTDKAIDKALNQALGD